MKTTIMLAAFAITAFSGAAFAQTAEISVDPAGGKCPAGFTRSTDAFGASVCAQDQSSMTQSADFSVSKLSTGSDDGNETHGTESHDNSDSDNDSN